MSRMIRLVAFIAAMSTSAAVIPATMDSSAPAGGSGSTAPSGSGASGLTPADPPAKPSVIPGGPAALLIPAAILIGVAAAVSSGGGDQPAPFPATGTTGTL